jgi:hypothetical protein
MKTDQRVSQSRTSTLATRTLLRSFVKNPELYFEEDQLIDSLKSQGGLAKLEYTAKIDGEKVKKLPMSLNTLKSYSDQEFDDGFEGLNSLRLKAIDAIETHKARSVRPDSRSRVGLQTKIQSLEEELEKHRSINFILLQAIQSAMSSMRNIRDADDKDLREKRAQDGLARLRAITRMNPSPFDGDSKPTVVSMKDFKDEK